MTTRHIPLLSLALVLTAVPAFGAAEVAGQDVVFRHSAPGAKSVHVAGSFNGWKLENALQDADKDGTWELKLRLSEGRYSYKFVVDGTNWTHDPQQEAKEPDGHGGSNSILVVGKASETPKRQVTGSDHTKKSDFGSTQVRKKQLVFTGEVFFIDPSTKRLPDLGRMKPHGRIYTERFDISPRNFSEGFPGLSDRFEWFAIRYRGKFKVEKTGKYRLRLLSDDGARLYLNGKLCLDNDGLHGPKEVTRWVKLKKGEHDLVLDYMQGPALEVALQVSVLRPTSTTEEPLEACSAPLPPREERKKRRRR